MVKLEYRLRCHVAILFCKLNTFGAYNFLKKLDEIVRGFQTWMNT